MKSLILIFPEFFVKQSRILDKTHYSKSQIFVQKFNFDKKKTLLFSRLYNSNLFDNFSREIKVVNS